MSVKSQDAELFHDCVLASAKGADAVTFQTIGTITINNVAPGSKIVGVRATAVVVTPTSGASSTPILRINCPSLGWNNVDIVMNEFSVGIGITTNDSPQAVAPAFYPIKVPDSFSGVNIANAQVVFSIAGDTSYAGGWAAGVELIYTDTNFGAAFPSDKLYTALLSDRSLQFDYAEYQYGTATAASLTALASNTSSIIQGANRCVGVKTGISYIGTTASKPAVGYIEISGSINTPKRFLTPAYSGSLGIAVGSFATPKAMTATTNFKLPGQTYSPNIGITLAAATTENVQAVTSLLQRYN